MPGHQVRDQLAGAGAHAHAHHPVAGRQPKALVAGGTADDRDVVATHRPPAVPALPDLGADRLVQVLGRAALERTEPALVEADVEAGELHRAAEPEPAVTPAVVPGGDADRALAQDQRATRYQRRQRTGDQIALARLHHRTPPWH